MLILWISKNTPTPRQRDELERLFGPHELRLDVNPFADASEIKRRVHQAEAEEFVCVAPLSVLKKLIEFGLTPLTAKMQQCPPAEAEVETRGRHYKFLRFERLVAIDMRYEEVLPFPAGQMK